ncbi:ATP-binding protein, partial [Caballeronia arationis]|uniref:ATP-binding protein n=1 Tax=Caballeronia arationis TaxID=1777142 RepID=UPI000B060A55
TENWIGAHERQDETVRKAQELGTLEHITTANQPFGEWNKVFPDPAMTIAAVDRLVHHSTIFELNVESYRRRTALQRKQQGPGRPAQFATPNNVGVPPLHENDS